MSEFSFSSLWRHLYSSGGHSNMVAVGFSFPKMDARSSPIFEISGFATVFIYSV